jgi:hypothetical protein
MLDETTAGVQPRTPADEPVAGGLVERLWGDRRTATLALRCIHERERQERRRLERRVALDALAGAGEGPA